MRKLGKQVTRGLCGGLAGAFIFTATTYSMPVHYKKNGTWREIDITLKKCIPLAILIIERHRDIR